MVVLDVFLLLLGVALLILFFLFVKDRMPRNRTLAEQNWLVRPYETAVQKGYEIQIKGEPLPFVEPPLKKPDGYILNMDHKNKIVWLVKL